MKHVAEAEVSSQLEAQNQPTVIILYCCISAIHDEVCQLLAMGSTVLKIVLS